MSRYAIPARHTLIHVSVLAALAGGMNVIWYNVSGQSVDPLEGSTAARIVTGSFLLLGIVTEVRYLPQTVGSLSRLTNLVVPFIAVALLSTVWSVAPGVTLRRAGALALTGVYAVTLAQRYHPTAVVRLLILSLGVVVCSSVVVELFFPSVLPAPYQYPDAWSGIILNKNPFGSVCALSALASVPLLFSERGWRRWAAFALLGLSIVALIKARAFAALLAFFVSLSAMLVLATWMRSKTLGVVTLLEVGLLSSAVMLWILSNLESSLQFVGRDITLTGRIPLWTSLSVYILDRWLLGYGYGGFWHGHENAFVILSKAGWLPVQAHNVYIEFLLGLGVVGTLLWLFLLATALLRTATVTIKQGYRYGLVPVTWIVFISIYGLMDSGILSYSSIGLMIIIWSYIWPQHF